MIEFFPQIKSVHVFTALLSGSLFLVRGLFIALGSREWPLWAPMRYLSYSIDTLLLTAAFMLMTVLHQYPGVHHWLTVKVVLVLVYIVLGVLAFSERRSALGRWVFYLAALVTFATIYSVARAHHPLGWIAPMID